MYRYDLFASVFDGKIRKWLVRLSPSIHTITYTTNLPPHPQTLQIKVKLQNERAARDLWDVLEDFPPLAVLLNTHLLHCVLDLVGAPFSQADVGKLLCLIVHKGDVPNILKYSISLLIFLFTDADPHGLHCLSALKWLETLLQKCTHAFSVQLDGSLCTHSSYNNNDNSQKEDVPDLAGKLVSVCLLIFGIQVTLGYIRGTKQAMHFLLFDPL